MKQCMQPGVTLQIPDTGKTLELSKGGVTDVMYKGKVMSKHANDVSTKINTRIFSESVPFECTRMERHLRQMEQSRLILIH